MKRLAFLILSLCVAFFAFSACGPKEKPSEPTAPEKGEEQTTPSHSEPTAPSEKPNENKEEKFMDTIYLTIGTHKITVKLEENAATRALVELLKEGDITYTAHDYGGFEKVGSLGHTLPREDRQMTTEAGDVILYSGNQIVLFYGSNSWSYTKLGKMQGSMGEIKEILTEINPVTVTIGLQ